MTTVSIFPILEAHARADPDRAAVVGEAGRVGYGELVDRIAAMAGWLIENGIVSGEPVGVSLQDETNHLVCAMALLALGAPQVNLPSHEIGENKKAIAAKVGARRIIAARAEEWMDAPGAVTPPFEALKTVTGARAPFPPAERPGESIAVYINTSGSTQVPKTFGLTHDRLAAMANLRAGEPSERCVLRTSSMEYDSSRLHRICALLAGNTCVFSERLDLESLGAFCARAGVSGIHIGTYKLASLLSATSARHPRLPSFTRVQTGGSRVSGALRGRVRERLTDNLWVSYATSEVGPISTATPDQHEAFPEGVGYPLPGVTVEIVDAEGQPVTPGAIGSARIRKANSPAGYIGDAAASASFRDGWFQPGDLLSQRPGEPLIYHGRVDDTMILNGINIFPAAIEDLLEGHPDVVEAIAYPIASRVHGEIPAAAVVLAENARDRNPAHFLDLCRRALGVRAPRRITIVDSIPRNAAGKPLRHLMSQA